MYYGNITKYYIPQHDILAHDDINNTNTTRHTAAPSQRATGANTCEHAHVFCYMCSREIDVHVLESTIVIFHHYLITKSGHTRGCKLTPMTRTIYPKPKKGIQALQIEEIRHLLSFIIRLRLSTCDL